jgi:hypothetical protein
MHKVLSFTKELALQAIQLSMWHDNLTKAPASPGCATNEYASANHLLQRRTAMRLGFVLPNIGPIGSPDAVSTVATRAEALGYDSLWTIERLL